MAVLTKQDDLTWVPFGSAPLIVTLVLPIVIGVFLLLKCILNHCCVRKTTTKEEMYGVEGRMTILPNAESSFVTTPLQSMPPLLSQNHSTQPKVTTVSTFSPSTSNNHSSSNNSATSRTNHIADGPNPLQIQQPVKRLTSYDRCDSQQSHRSSTATSASSSYVNSAATAPISAILIPNISPVSISSGFSAGDQQNTNAATAAADNHEPTVVGGQSDSLKRSTLHRQLPDLPQLPTLQGHHAPRRSSSLMSHDGNSELYATVGDVPNLNIPQSSATINPDERSYYNHQKSDHPSSSRVSRGVTTASSSSSKPGTSHHHTTNVNNSKEPNPSSDSETYAINHPYAKLKRSGVEHPYARVRTASTGTGGDETDTDNYDTPQPYAQTGRNSSNPSQNVSHHHYNSHNEAGHGDSPANAVSVTVGESSREGGGNPVPPRRTGRQWRRSSHPQALQMNGNQQQHFSGDSQDSRGYTSISVREPLSNIIVNRNEAPGGVGTRNYDSHYATVSDDSEEMYAAIEDSDGNYMRIPGDGEPGGLHWHGGAGIASPIPERREANSPLPPPPPVPPLASPPELTPGGPLVMDQVKSSSSSALHQPAPSSTASTSQAPVYAQVAKKNKKYKAPVTPTSSINSISSQPISGSNAVGSVNVSSSGNGNGNNNISTKSNEVKTATQPSLSPQLSISSSHNHSVSLAGASTNTSTVSGNIKNARHGDPSNMPAVLSPSDGSGNSEPRRWSKADISYSEFDVVREPLFTANLANLGHRRKSPEMSSSSPASYHPHHHQKQQQLQEPHVPERKITPSPQDVLDEDNYNVIPEPGPSTHVPKNRVPTHVHDTRSNRECINSSNKDGGGSKVRKASTNSGNYQEIAESYHQHQNPYQEIERKEPSDYYQEIGGKVLEQNGLDLSNLYQEISSKKNSRDIEDDDDDDLNDQFYETVKPAGAASGTSVVTKPKYMVASPSHSQNSVTSLDRKHGYEKLKKKGSGPPTVVIIASDDDDDDEDEDENKNDEDDMYERVKYPPYERLKESRDDLHNLPHDDPEDSNNFYEDIGYSRVKHKHGSNKKEVDNMSRDTSRGNADIRRTHHHDAAPSSSSVSSASHTLHLPALGGSLHSQQMDVLDSCLAETTTNLDQLYARIDKSKKKNKHASPTETSGYSPRTSHLGTNSDNIGGGRPTVTTKQTETPSKACIVLRTDRDDNSIEYI